MKNQSTLVKAGAFAVALVALTLLLSPAICRWMSAYAASSATADTTESAGETGMAIPFLAELASADAYGIDGTKSVSGQDGSYSVTFNCAVQGDNFAIKTEKQGHTYRQLYLNGQYVLVDDTSQTVQNGVLQFDYMDKNLTEAVSGKIIRTSGEIINGNQVDRVEIYKNGMVYAYYFNKQGVLIRFYYIYEGNEVTLDLGSVVIGGSSTSFDIPSTYSIK